MKRLKGSELGKVKTFITTFMSDRSTNHKTFEDLLKIYNDSHDQFRENGDQSNDLRSDRYGEDMENRNWREPIILLEHNGLIIDGIHRGIAYLQCFTSGIKEENLPEIYTKPYLPFS